MARKLRDDLLLRLVLPMATILVVSGVVSYQLANRFATRSFDRSLLEDARSLSRLVRTDRAGRVQVPPGAMEMLGAGQEDRIYLQIRKQQGAVIAGDIDLPSPPESEFSEPVFYDGQARGQSLRLVAFALPAPADPGILVLGETRRRRESLASDIFAAVVAPQLALMLFAVAVIVGGVASGLAPLEALAGTIKARRRDDLAPLPEDSVPGEAAPLIEAFNGLLARVADVLASQQRFVADSAHQLRTPLAVLKVQLEHALRETDPVRQRLLLEQLLGSVDRMARLSSQLLLLARAEPGGGPQARERLDLRALAREVGALWVPRALQAGRDLGFSSGDDPAWIAGDRTLVGEMIANLLDNALRYGGRNVTLGVAGTAAGAELIVEDDGAGIPESERARAFERFHRVPGTVGEGSGLGLAIVREIASGHGASVSLESPDSGGFWVRIRFPVYPHGIDEIR